MAVGKPRTPKEKPEKPERPERKLHPLLENDGKLKELPSDYSPKIHKPLTRKNFEDESVFYRWKCEDFRKRADRFERLATEGAKLGNVQDKKRARKLLDFQSKMEELRRQLEQQGVNVDELLSAGAK